MKKNLKWVFCRHPRTTAERRANQEGWERARRRGRYLPNAYDDMFPKHEKGWKQKRKTQYYPNGRGKEHSIIVSCDFTYEWDLIEYFREHNIPYRLENIYESEMCKLKKWKKVKTQFKRPIYHVRRTKKDGVTDVIRTFLRWEDSYQWEEDGWYWQAVSKTVAYKLTWWYNKDIGIDRILNQCRRRRFTW